MYQIIYLAILVLGTILSATKHGQMRKKPVNIYLIIIAKVIALFLLYKGGFFNNILSQY